MFRPLVTTRPEGMGIGLSMSRIIVEMHGGRLWATPNAGAGATFHVMLPVGDCMPEAFTPTVFVVDDDPSVRTAVKRLLASVGLPCETFSTAAEFLARSEQGVSGCLVLDVRMPGASGLDLQRMLNHAGTDLPIIFVTAHADVPLTVGR